MPRPALGPGEHGTPATNETSDALRSRGPFVSTVRYRPHDGSDVKLLRRFGATSEEAELKLLGALDVFLGRTQTVAPDSPVVRELIVAASFNYDLSEAAEALERASDADSLTARMLRSYAVIAYCRTFGSKVRPDLTTLIALDDFEQALDAKLRAIRNRFAGHSESRMATTFPVVDLKVDDDGQVAVEMVRGMTAVTSLPASLIADFAAFIGSLKAKLVAHLDEVKKRVAASFTPEQLAALFDDPQRLQVNAVDAVEWTPAQRRGKYPASRLTDMPLDRASSTDTRLYIV
ncbi:hypothetical protein [Microbacterium hydrocarbonoxydans]|uniref:hypothetical protein n=1 Tax=Microbacterium hydrocarbonoxydans TaxID=273678 RepID=UPI003D96D7DB